MRTIVKIAVLTFAILISVTAFGKKIEFKKTILWDAQLNSYRYYCDKPYEPYIQSNNKTLNIYETPPANTHISFGNIHYETQHYEFHKVSEDPLLKEDERSFYNADTLYYFTMYEQYRELKCKVIKGDTLVTNVDHKCKLSEYMAKAPINAKMAWLKPYQEQFIANRKAYLTAVAECEQHNAKIQAEYARDSVIAANSLAAVERKIQAQNEEEKQALAKAKAEWQRKEILLNLDADISDPDKPLQTKTFTNAMGAKVTYQYYLDDNGYEVKHGKFTATMTYKNHKYWTGNMNYGWVYLDGTESSTYYYKNGIVHGHVTYSSNLSTSSTFGNDQLLKRNISFDIYKGVITGDFKFSYKNIIYTGKATNGILDYCDYETDDDMHYHGKLTSNSAGNEISIPVIYNGYREFEFNDLITLPHVCCGIPGFYFPRIGK